MIITAIKTSKITVRSQTLTSLLDQYITALPERSVVAVTSKIVSLCEGSAIPAGSADKETLLVQESDKYLPASFSKYGHHFTITEDTLIPMAGIDESNADDNFVLWPRDVQNTCNEIREYLSVRFGLKEVGVIITDSTTQPLRRGTSGICLAHSGFLAVHDYIGTPDLFDRTLKITRANVSGGLAAAAVLCMGEGAEQTPLAVISDVDFVEFQSRNPSVEELEFLHISLDDDLFSPFLSTAPWQSGQRHNHRKPPNEQKR